MIRRAIILAAGRGARLSPHTDDRPKCLLQLGAGTLLSRQFDACMAVGIDDIVVITGYEFGMMEDEIMLSSTICPEMKSPHPAQRNGAVRIVSEVYFRSRRTPRASPRPCSRSPRCRFP